MQIHQEVEKIFGNKFFSTVYSQIKGYNGGKSNLNRGRAVPCQKWRK
ncbi:hypothetical protein CLOSTMETH_00211 [[Clostridium] methylpentosum DSM 5476]|uniref:Uncharacterized protein n=1 Tax=[Clostridium] methylpentosum DSM 5476 TaxID=537013 RepID=C0E8R6_9FIRM|nr:hypothetical protein CLOSTMETH_00211 [[Clostridium] methylpentosum DSM 5476]